jgi:hypothetical protein
MADFVFDPPLRLKREITVRTLGEAADFARNFVGPSLPGRRDSIMKGLEAASDREKGRAAANAFQEWAKAEGLLLDER